MLTKIGSETLVKVNSLKKKKLKKKQIKQIIKFKVTHKSRKYLDAKKLIWGQLHEEGT